MLFAANLFMIRVGVSTVLRGVGGRLSGGSGVNIIGGVSKTREMNF